MKEFERLVYSMREAAESICSLFDAFAKLGDTLRNFHLTADEQ